ncbi:MAG: sigma-70 family RNA polymerase sigma factor [Paraglaciecola sp.]|uniref:RNA polymerase sigma factor n=1 Tax=Paraglaciecola sp. TaxID=1920173 RepID=UPI00329685E4
MDKSYTLNFEEALQEFIAQTKPQQLALLAKMVSMGEAEEILQEAYLKIYLFVSKNPNKQRPLEQLKSLTPMLYSIAKNLAISNIRHQKVVNLHLQQTGSCLVEDESQKIYSSESELIKQDEEALILRAINQLPPICRQVFVQRKLHSKSNSDIAAMLGISIKTVESHLAKGLFLCREYVRKSKRINKGKLRANSN